MPLEAKDYAEFLGVDPAKIETREQLQESFSSKFIPKDPTAIKADADLHGRIIGAYNGSVSTLIRRQAKEAGVELTDDELKGKNPMEMVDYALPKIISPIATKIKTLEENAGKSTDKKIEEIQSAFEQYKAEVAPKITGYETLQKEYEDFKVGVETEKKTLKVSQYNDEAWKGFKWANGKSELEKEGFQSRFNKKYRTELFDGTPWPVNEKGERIPNPKQAGAYKSLSDLLVEEGTAANVYAVAGQQSAAQNMQRGTFTVKEDMKSGEAAASPQRMLNTGVRSRGIKV